jgi:cyclophilin family peptidyl-prolyl cis-trans isomerase
MSSRLIRKNKPSSIRARSRNKKIAVIATVAAIVVVVVAFVMLSQGSTPNNVTPSPTPTSSPSASPAVVYNSLAAPVTTPAGEYSASGTRILFMVTGIDSSGNPFNGNITLQMRDDKPITTQNFIKLVNQGLYDGTLFHRVIAGFMIQGGQNHTSTVASINDEIGNDNHNYVGTIAMAKTSAPNSATSEFFINTADNSQIHYQDGTSFDGTYTVFGQIIGGMDIITKIASVQVQANPLMGNENSQPVYPVTVLKAVVLS